MLKQLLDMKSNKISVLQTAGKGTSCPACVWQTDLHTGTAAVCEPALSLLHTTAAIYLYGFRSSGVFEDNFIENFVHKKVYVHINEQWITMIKSQL